jgi:hypothetical protein
MDQPQTVRDTNTHCTSTELDDGTLQNGGVPE